MVPAAPSRRTDAGSAIASAVPHALGSAQDLAVPGNARGLVIAADKTIIPGGRSRPGVTRRAYRNFRAYPALKDSVGECVFWDFCHGSCCKVETSKVRDAGSAERGAVQPGIDADEVDGGGGQDVGEMGLGLATVGSAAQPGAADGLGDGALDAGADVVAGFPLCGLLLGALPGEQFVLFAGQQGQAASPLAIGRLGAPGPQRAWAAGGEREVDLGYRGAAGFALIGPADADGCLGAGDRPRVPVDAEGGLGQGRFLPGAAAPGLVGVGADGPEQGDAVVVAGGEDVAGADVAGLHPLLPPHHPTPI